MHIFIPTRNIKVTLPNLITPSYISYMGLPTNSVKMKIVKEGNMKPSVLFQVENAGNSSKLLTTATKLKTT